MLCSHDASLSLNLLVARTVALQGVVSALFMWAQASSKGVDALVTLRQKHKKKNKQQTNKENDKKQTINRSQLSVFCFLFFVFCFLVLLVSKARNHCGRLV